MALIKQAKLVEDRWRFAESEADLAYAGPLFVTLALWREQREALLARGAPLGLRLANDQAPEEIGEDLRHFAAVSLEFPKFNDGRAFSQARILRQRLGFDGELRAIGHVLRDQLLFMERCGFDAYQFPDEARAQDALEALSEFSVWYQSAGDRRRPVAFLRHRQAAE